MIGENPKTIAEFHKLFASENACRKFLFKLRWRGGFVCPRCQGSEIWPTTRDLLVCKACGHQASLTAGTLFQDTHKPLSLWFRAMWWVTRQENGASALSLQRELGLGSYRTAWSWLHKMRRAMVRPGRDRLRGTVEIDETYLAAIKQGGRGGERKSLIIVAAEKDGRRIGRIRMRRIPDASADNRHAFILDSVQAGSTIHTHGAKGYQSMKNKGYDHKMTAEGALASSEELLPSIHRVISRLKRWLLDTHQGAVSDEHLDYYLDEFTFRFNYRSPKQHRSLFYRLVEQAVAMDPSPYRAIIKRVRGRKDTAKM